MINLRSTPRIDENKWQGRYEGIASLNLQRYPELMSPKSLETPTQRQVRITHPASPPVAVTQKYWGAEQATG